MYDELLDLIEATQGDKLPWFLGCEYGCKICKDGFIFRSPESLKNHADSNHGSFWSYILETGLLETKTIYHECQLCDDKNVKKSYSGIKHHLAKNHPKVSFLKYSKLIEFDSEEINEERTKLPESFDNKNLEIDITFNELTDIQESIRSDENISKEEDYILDSNETKEYILEPKIEPKNEQDPFKDNNNNEEVEFTECKRKPDLNSEESKKELIQKFTCQNCGAVFRDNYHLGRHLNNFDDLECQKGVCPQSDLVKANELKMLLEKSTCKQCGKVFLNSKQQKRHFMNEKNEKLKCEKCGRMYSTKRSLKYHYLVHTDERPHVCDICGKAFRTTMAVSCHKETHNPQPRECQICKKMVKSSAMNQHMYFHKKKRRTKSKSLAA